MQAQHYNQRLRELREEQFALLMRDFRNLIQLLKDIFGELEEARQIPEIRTRERIHGPLWN